MNSENREEIPGRSKPREDDWKASGEISAWSIGGARRPEMLSFWGEFFNTVAERYESPSLVDIACGNGAVIEYALTALGDRTGEIHCVGSSELTIANIESRFEQVSGLVADAASIPLESGRFDVVTSQFGAEYAGPRAFNEAARLVAENGRLGLMVHCAEGQIFQECSVNRDILESVLQSEFVAKAGRMFEAGFEAVRGADRAPYDQAAKRFAPAVQLLETIMTEHGEDVADGTIARLYSDVAGIHGRIQHYDPDEVLAWLQRMDHDLESYTKQMASLCEAAIDEESFDRLCENLVGQGFSVESRAPLLPAQGETPLAWTVIAKR